MAIPGQNIVGGSSQANVGHRLYGDQRSWRQRADDAEKHKANTAAGYVKDPLKGYIPRSQSTNSQNQRADKLDSMLPGSGLPSGGSVPGLPPTVPGPGGAGGMGGTPGVTTAGGNNAELLRAKERQGQLARSAVTGLREALGERQMLGSGAEAQATSDIASDALSSLTDVNREQLIQDDDNATRLAELTYQGGIQQRGQDIMARGQDLQARTAGANTALAQQNMILDALRQMVY